MTDLGQSNHPVTYLVVAQGTPFPQIGLPETWLSGAVSQQAEKMLRQLFTDYGGDASSTVA